MLHANKLMIGDWYAFRGHPYKCTASDIASIAECEEKGAPTDISEIPLTPEILEKNGFRKLVTYGTEKWLSNNVRLNVYDSEGTWRFCANTNRNEDSVIYIRFVHQLQHCLKLVGIEKEITL